MRTKAAQHMPRQARVHTYTQTHLNCTQVLWFCIIIVIYYNYYVILTEEIAVKWIMVESVVLQAGSIKDTRTLYFYIRYLLITNCSKLYGAGGCFQRDGQVVSRKPEVNLRLSGPEADWSQTGMCLTDFLRDPLSPSGMLLSFGTSLFYNLCLTRLAPLKATIIACTWDAMKFVLSSRHYHSYLNS